MKCPAFFTVHLYSRLDGTGKRYYTFLSIRITYTMKNRNCGVLNDAEEV